MLHAVADFRRTPGAHRNLPQNLIPRPELCPWTIQRVQVRSDCLLGFDYDVHYRPLLPRSDYRDTAGFQCAIDVICSLLWISPEEDPEVRDGQIEVAAWEAEILAIHDGDFDIPPAISVGLLLHHLRDRGDKICGVN